jgi:hypothetical protein
MVVGPGKSGAASESESESSSGGGVDFGDVRVREYLGEELEVNRNFLHMGTRITGLNYLLKVCVPLFVPLRVEYNRSFVFILIFRRRRSRTLRMSRITRWS